MGSIDLYAEYEIGDRTVNRLGKAIQSAIEKSESPNSAGSINFYWDEAEKVWCLAGSTKDGLYFETDDVGADNYKDAVSQAIDHLESN